MIGQTILHYRITARLGAGGMGEVYRSTDTRLGREVALKFLPDLFADDAERLARFQREAQLLASLNHPHIAAIYGLEESAGIHFLALELVEGPTLAERIAEGPMPMAEALGIAMQIAEALEAAHEKPIIHRDLKPANIKLTADGQVKVLDFGLAKALEGEMDEDDIANSPTLSRVATRAGVLLGTAAYMSPEQAKGKRADRRADIFAFGVVFYEMLTGKQAFSGDSIPEILAGVLKQEMDWSALPSDTPPAIRRLLRRCLEKDARRRLRDIGDARMEIVDTLAAPQAETAIAAPAVAPPMPAQPLWQRALPWSLAAVLAAVTALAFWRPWIPAPARPVVARFAASLQPSESLNPATGGLAISPDGAYIAYMSTPSSGAARQLFLRAMDRAEAIPIPGAEGATGLFFSPDSQWIAFTAGGKLKKVPRAGGTPITLCDKSIGHTGTWGPDGTIYFFEPAGKLMRVPGAGGAPEVLATIEAKPGENEPRWPEVLPGGEAILFAMGGTPLYDDATIIAQSLKTGERKTLIQGGTSPRYLSTGHIVYGQGGRLLAIPFDLRRLEVTGAAAPVLEDVWQAAGGFLAYGVSGNGSLAYVNGGQAGVLARSTLHWVDRSGDARPVGSAHAFVDPSLSPDGQRLAIRNGDIAALSDIYVSDLNRGTLTRLTFAKPGEQTYSPVWTPDGTRVIYSLSSGAGAGTAGRGGAWKIMWRSADGSGAEESLFSGTGAMFPLSISPDGQLLVFQQGPVARRDLWVLPLAGERKARPLLEGSFDEVAAQISPDGRWLAYVSNETGRQEVYVQPFPGLGGKWQVSATGGTEPRWSRDGRQLFYRSGNKMMAVDVQTRSGFAAGTPRMLFDQPYAINPNAAARYDVAPDGQHFLMLKVDETLSSPLELRVVLNWADEVQRRLVPVQN
jgi:serine/threonine-protein kinase